MEAIWRPSGEVLQRSRKAGCPVRQPAFINYYSLCPSRYSSKSPGWQSSALQMASSVDSRTALALPFFKMDKFAIVMPTRSESSVTLIFLFASITSILMIIAIAFTPYQTIKSFSALMRMASCSSFWRTAAKTAITSEAKITNSPIRTPGASSAFVNK